VIAAFVDDLALSGVTQVAHDWGGRIGLATVQQHPEAFDRLVLANSWAWPIGAPHVQIMSHLMGSPIGRLLIRQFNLFANVMIPAGHRLTKPTNEQMSHYQKALQKALTAPRGGKRRLSSPVRSPPAAPFSPTSKSDSPTSRQCSHSSSGATPTSRSGATNCDDGSRPSPTTTPSSSKGQVTSSNPMPPSSSRQRSATGTLPQGHKWPTTHD
jgi:hypothetical protein